MSLADRALHLAVVADAVRKGTHEMTPQGWDDFCTRMDRIVEDLAEIENVILRKKPPVAAAPKPAPNVVEFRTAKNAGAEKPKADPVGSALDYMQRAWLEDAKSGAFVPFSDGHDGGAA